MAQCVSNGKQYAGEEHEISASPSATETASGQKTAGSEDTMPIQSAMAKFTINSGKDAKEKRAVVRQR